MKTRFIAVPALAFFALAPIAHADDKADIKALYVKISTAMKNRDVKAIMATGTADFKSKENGQVMDAKTSEQMLKAQFASMKSVQEMKMTPDKITVSGKQATVISSFSMKATVSDPQDKKKSHTMAGSGTMKDLLVKDAGVWKFKMVETLTNNMSMDGKPMPEMSTPAAAPSAIGGKKKK